MPAIVLSVSQDPPWEQLSVTVHAFVSISSAMMIKVIKTTDNEIFVDELLDLKSDPVVKLVLALHKNSSGLDKRQKNGKAQVQANN